MRQPVIEYTIQFYMHAATYTHVHTTLPPYSASPHQQRCARQTESTECNVQRAVRETRSKTVIVTQKHNNVVLKNAMLWGRRRTYPEWSQGGRGEGGGTDPPHRKSDLSGGGYIRVRGGGGRPPPTGATHTHTKHPPHSIV